MSDGGILSGDMARPEHATSELVRSRNTVSQEIVMKIQHAQVAEDFDVENCKASSCFSTNSKKAKSATLWLCSVLLLGALGLQANAADKPESSGSTAPKKETHGKIIDSYSRSPLSFEANRGQTAEQVKFVSRGPDYTLFLTNDEAVLALKNRSKIHPTTGSTLRLQLAGANPHAIVNGLEELPGKSNYFVGNDPKQWQTSSPNYAKVRYHDVYPGVDLTYYGTHQQLEFDFIVAAGADPTQIALHLQADPSAKARHQVELRVDNRGDLVETTEAREFRLRKPTVYQLVANASGTIDKKMVETKYVLKKNNQVGFEVGSYDKTRDLVIDPVVPFYSTYLGGAAKDYGFSIAVDTKGNAYITGATASLHFPVPGCVFGCAYNGGAFDVFVTELNSAGFPVYSDYLGGAGTDYGYGIAVDFNGSAYVTGATNSLNFPVPGCIICGLRGGFDAFVTEVAPGGAGLIYSTYLGGKGNDYGRAIAVDNNGDAYVTGGTSSHNFPMFACAFCVFQGGASDAFVTELKPFGVGFVFSTYLGGKGNDYGYGITFDPNERPIVTGSTTSLNFPVVAGCFQCANAGLSDAFVTEFNFGGAGLLASTYLGGAGNDYAYAIAQNTEEGIYITGSTASLNFPVVNCLQCVFQGGSSDAFVTHFNPALTGLVYSTYLGGGGTDSGRGIALDAKLDALITGYTSSVNFPVANCFQCVYNGGASDAFVTSLIPPGPGLNFSTYLGGKGNDYGYGIGVNLAFNPLATFVTGSTTSVNFPVLGCFQCVNGGAADAFVVGLP